MPTAPGAAGDGFAACAGPAPCDGVAAADAPPWVDPFDGLAIGTEGPSTTESPTFIGARTSIRVLGAFVTAGTARGGVAAPAARIARTLPPATDVRSVGVGGRRAVEAKPLPSVGPSTSGNTPESPADTKIGSVTPLIGNAEAAERAYRRSVAAVNRRFLRGRSLIDASTY